MQQEIQYLKGITQEMKPGNNHTPTAYNETNEVKKLLERLTKIHQEHSETSNKGIINIENDIRNIDIELAKQTKKVSEQMKVFEKADSSVKELWGIVDSLVDNGNPWFIVGKNGKSQKPSEPTEKVQEAKKVNNLN